MESLTPHRAYLKDLRQQVVKLISDSLSLVTLLIDESNRLKKEDQVSSLEALSLYIKEQIERTEDSEDSAKYGYYKAGVVISSIGLAASIGVRLALKGKRSRNLSKYLLSNVEDKQPHFGTVLVSVGPGGLPEDVEVVSISRLARETNRDEPEVIKRLLGHGYLLFDGESFSHLIQRLIADIQEGLLLLPIPIQELAKIQSSGRTE